ncbi:MAG: hypothetical protein LBV72_14480 [Tannerella sp.]|jgi:hypothetical protein|nr:hypothetical protein [Tannerella sp.]
MTLKKALTLLFWGLLPHICFAHVFYIDPVNGNDSGNGSISNPWKTLEYVVNNNLIESTAYATKYDSNNPQTIIKNAGAPVRAGDTLMLYNGLHGNIFILSYINPSFITIKAMPSQTPILEKCHLRGAKNWRFEGITISSEPYGNYLNDVLFYLDTHSWHGPVSNIEIKNCIFYSTVNPWITTEDWNNKSSHGIKVNADNILLQNNTFKNVNFGAIIRGNYNQIIGNSIINFAGDGIAMQGSNNLLEANLIKNCYKVDDNHDDGIQSYALGGIAADNNIIRGNMILNYEDPNQPLLGPLQGIGCFDGPFHYWIVENNIVIVDHWHGIAFYGAIDCVIRNNTALDPAPSNASGPSWIDINEKESNGVKSANCIVKNNIVNTLRIKSNSNTQANNNLLITATEDYIKNFVNYANYDFHLLQSSPAIDNGDATCSPTIDFEGNTRPQGNAPDIGAYEFVVVQANVTLTVLASPTIGGQVNGSGSFLPNSAVTVKAIPAMGYLFKHWEINGIAVSTEEIYSFNISSDTKLIAIFAEDKANSVSQISTEIKISAYEGTIHIQSDKKLGVVSIHTIGGQCLYHQESSDTDDLHITGLPKEVLVVTIGKQRKKIWMK